MASTATYLNFKGNCEEAFDFYQEVFQSELAAPPMRFGDAPPGEDLPPMSEEAKRQIMHMAMPITGGHQLMGSDVPPAMHHGFVAGTNVQISLSPDTRAETERLFAALGEGGEVKMPLQEQFWGDYFGLVTDKFGIHWMVGTAAKE